MISIIAGGCESLKLIRALRYLLNDDEIAVIANTSDSLWIDGTLASPDIDDLIFLFSGILNTKSWHGIKGDTFTTCSFFMKYFEDGAVQVGDKERAVHMARGRYLSEGESVTQATEHLCRRFGIGPAIRPATDNTMELRCRVGDEYFHPFILRQKSAENELDIIGDIMIEYFNRPVVSKEVSSVLSASDAVIIGPGRPLTSIMPVIACSGFKELLANKFTVSFAPPFPENPSGFPLSNYNRIISAYTGFSDIIIQNSSEKNEIEGAMLLDTRMVSRHSAESLAWDLMSVIRSRGY